MEITEEMKFRLAELIKEAIQADFEYVHLSGNLMESIEIYEDVATGKVIVEVLAPRYSLATYRKKGVIVYTGKGSYANTVDKNGGFSKKHKDYVERAISAAVSIWMNEYNLEVRKS